MSSEPQYQTIKFLETHSPVPLSLAQYALTQSQIRIDYQVKPLEEVIKMPKKLKATKKKN